MVSATATPVAFLIALAPSPKKAKASKKVVVEAMMRQVIAFEICLILFWSMDYSIPQD